VLPATGVSACIESLALWFDKFRTGSAATGQGLRLKCDFVVLSLCRFAVSNSRLIVKTKQKPLKLHEDKTHEMHEVLGWSQPQLTLPAVIAVRISVIARSNPTKMERATMLWPMLNSPTSAIAATAPTFR
jgi:hypothetical protein